MSNVKPEVGRAQRAVMHSRKPIEVLIEKQRARVAKLDERIGVLMNKRVDEEQVLADLIALAPRDRDAVSTCGRCGDEYTGGDCPRCCP